LSIAFIAPACSTGAKHAANPPAKHDYACRAVTGGSHDLVEVFADGKCIGATVTGGTIDCASQPTVSKVVGGNYFHEGRGLQLEIEGDFPERQCIVKEDGKVVHRQRVPFHDEYFPPIDPIWNVSAARRKELSALSPLKALETSDGWTLVFRGASLLELERSAVIQGTADWERDGPRVTRAIGDHPDAEVVCGRARGNLVRTFCTDPFKSVWSGYVYCNATVQLDGGAFRRAQEVEQPTSNGGN
jgi:hypothetical protein